MIRVGRISYVNMAPLFFRLDADTEQVIGVPVELNAKLLAGELDVAPISSIEYGRNAERLRILPRLCISSEGAVDSIQLVSRSPLSRIERVGVTSESATAAVLVRVLLPDAEQVSLEEEADARLLIGDAALAERVRGSNSSLRPWATLAGAHGTSDGLCGFRVFRSATSWNLGARRRSPRSTQACAC